MKCKCNDFKANTVALFLNLAVADKVILSLTNIISQNRHYKYKTQNIIHQITSLSSNNM